MDSVEEELLSGNRLVRVWHKEDYLKLKEFISTNIALAMVYT